MMKRSALIVVDMLYDFLDPQGALFCGPDSRKIIPEVTRLLDEHRHHNSLIVFVLDNHAEDDLEFKRFPPHCVAGQPGSQLITEIVSLPGELQLPKHRYSAFFKTNLEEILYEAKVEEIHLCGVCTSICVMETCSDLRNHDYEVWVHEKAVADFDSEAHTFALKRMKNILGAQIIT